MAEVLLDASGFHEKLVALKNQIKEGVGTFDSVALVGIQRRGAFLSSRLAKMIAEDIGKELPHGVLDISLYRDDVSRRSKLPIVRPTRLNFDLNEKRIVLIDDVLFTGRTVRAGMNELMDYGRAASVQLAVLVDRGCRELPIQPDYVALNHEVGLGQRVFVHMKELDGKDEVFVKEDAHGMG